MLFCLKYSRFKSVCSAAGLASGCAGEVRRLRFFPSGSAPVPSGSFFWACATFFRAAVPPSVRPPGHFCPFLTGCVHPKRSVANFAALGCSLVSRRDRSPAPWGPVSVWFPGCSRFSFLRAIMGGAREYRRAGRGPGAALPAAKSRISCRSLAVPVALGVPFLDRCAVCGWRGEEPPHRTRARRRREAPL